MRRLDEKSVIVTGGAKGIGEAACREMAREGARVAITDILDEDGRKLADEISSEGGNASYWHLDVSDEEEVSKTFSGIYKEFGRIDVLVNNAGISGVNKPTDEIDADEWQKVIDINAKGVFLCTKHVISYMKKQGGGSIINMSSIYGIIGAPDSPP